ncbi:hypothetical protein ACFOOK_06730 [Micromonospora krabiensis]|uniref:Uncharacterized protein n=1 Tax=Micromonospora krabiensis TaxID=307121 RepID=A0A1C3NCP9_9ACTN|nr:hypothetical protein [Micromonospora krabiensis]SBV30308.1 hypothetical protein GA0070620_5903 [Micromonospora krabiensis]
MAQGEAEHGCAQGEPCRPGHHDQPAAAKHRRPVGAIPPIPLEPVGHRPVEAPGARPAEAPGPRPVEEDAPVPRQRSGEAAPPVEPEPVRAVSSCRSDLPGWAGAHRHGAVRPPQRAGRRERPPRRWC